MVAAEIILKRVLIISYHFAPGSEVGGLRAQEFAKYFPRFDCRLIVLTVSEKYYGALDVARNSDVTYNVYRTQIAFTPPGSLADVLQK